MKASELRYGNLIESHFSGCNFAKGIVKVDFYVMQKIHLYNGLQSLKPIPLTDEWLLKFGFEKIIVEDYPLYIYDGFIIEVYTDNCVVSYNNTEITKIKYVHQLQNLYFALTNNEIEIL